MNNPPKTIYVEVDGFMGQLLAGRTSPLEIEYRLVEDCEWSESKVTGAGKFGGFKYDTQCGRDHVEFAKGYCSCGNKIKVVE